MSVRTPSADELGVFAAICVAESILPAESALLAAALASSGAAAAHAAQYDEPAEPVTAAEIHAAYKRALDDERLRTVCTFGPLVYNMADNAGRSYVNAWAGPVAPGSPEAQMLEMLHRIELKARAWQDAEAGKLARAEQNAAAYNDVGQLPTLTREEILNRCDAPGCDRVIVAAYYVNESDSQTDYYGGRCARQVVIGFGKGKRESFAQLRKAAGAFGPTAHMGPGRDRWRAHVVFAEDCIGPGRGNWKGSYSHWHDRLGHRDREFTTEAEAREFTTAAGEPYPVQDGETLATFAWEFSCDSYEHRENWSMGGGNYLGVHRYGGWQVYSIAPGSVPARVEVSI